MLPIVFVKKKKKIEAIYWTATQGFVNNDTSNIVIYGKYLHYLKFT